MLYDMFTSLDRIAADLFSAAGASSAWGGGMDLRRERDAYVLEADLPGFEEKDIDVSLDGQMLTVRAERSSERETTGAWLVRERAHASVMRQFALGQDVEPDGASAAYRDGVLRVMIPVREHASARRIPVASAHSASAALPGEASTARPESHEGKARPAHSLA
jgi:HSP20 family protein